MGSHLNTLVVAAINCYSDMVESTMDNLCSPSVAVALVGLGEDLARGTDGQFLGAITNFVSVIKKTEKKMKKFTKALEDAKNASHVLKEFSEKIEEALKDL